MPESNRRENFRIVYPHQACPAFVWRGEMARVIDCSERGFRMEVQCYHDLPKLDDRVEGRIVFLDGSAVGVQGIVRHVRQRVVGVHFEQPGVPWRVLLREQVTLRIGGPDWAPPDA
jgi:hypothetical protein